MLGKLVYKYRNLSLPLKTSLWFVICNVIQKGIIFLSTPIFTRVLTQEEYGVVSVYNSWLGIITIIATLQLAQGGFNKAMIKFEYDRDGYTSSVFTLSLITTTLTFFVITIFIILFRKEIDLPYEFVLLLFIEVIFSNAMATLTSRERFEFRYRFVVIITLIANILATLFSLLLVVETKQAHAFMRVLGTTSIHAVVYSVTIYLIYKRGKKLYVRNYWSYAIKFNILLIPHYLSQQVLNSSDRIMINNIIGPGDAAKYSLAYQIAAVMGVLTNAIHATFAPWTYQKINAGEYRDIGKRAFQLEMIIGGICILFSSFAPEIIFMLAPNNYYEAIYVIPPVSMGVFFLFVYSFFGNIEFYFEKTKFIMVASCVVAITNVGLNALCIPIFGFVAAGYTTLLCYFFYSVIHYQFMKKICRENNIPNPYQDGKMWLLALAYGVFSLCIPYLYGLFLLRYIVAALALIFLMICLIRNRSSIIGNG